MMFPITLSRTLLNWHLRYLTKPLMGLLRSHQMVRAISGVYAKLMFRPDSNMLFRTDELTSKGFSVNCFWCAMQVEREDKVILYLHGGAYTVGGLDSHGAMVARLAGMSGLNAVLLDYRLAPENPFPAALDDALCGYEALLSRGFSGDDIILAGDSAGGGLVFALLQRLQKNDLPKPRICVAISPWVDLSLTAKSCENNIDSDVMLPISWLRRSRDAYLSGRDVCDPEASPLFGCFEDPPPAYIVYATDEVLANDSLSLIKKLREAGGHVTLEEESSLPHVWTLFQGKFDQADKTLQQIAGFIRNAY